MLKKKITYTDYNDEERTEEFYFNLNKAELTEMSTSVNGGYDEYLKKLVNERDTSELMKLFKTIILMSYGEKSIDGKRFVKSPELSKAFEQTEAYSVLFMELASSTDAMTEFVTGIVPKDIAAEARKQLPDAIK